MNVKYAILIKDNDKSKELERKVKNLINLEYDEVHPEIVIAIGGDGTILRAIHQYEKRIDQIIIFGIHTGNLGFYSNFLESDIDLMCESINNSQYTIEKMPLLKTKIHTKNDIIEALAINEITVMNPSRTLILDVLIDDCLLESYRGTGLCISTPYGSTGYNKSLHGSVIDPTLKVMQLTEIAGINSNAYRTLGSPIVLNSNRCITFLSKDELEISVTVDQLSFQLKKFEKLDCFFNENYIKMGKVKEEGFINRIRRTFLVK